MYRIRYGIRIGQPCGEFETRLFVGPLWLIITISHYTATYAEIVPLSVNPVPWQMGYVYYDNPINASHSTPDLIPVVFAWMALAILIF